MKNILIFSLILMAVLFPQWSTPVNLTATAAWLWLPEIKLHWHSLIKINEQTLKTMIYTLIK
ncbi:MAG: hypothetical protein QNL62_19320 [Gammaproteobacteria bacterium]|nr:hypothetical protein [Gammaproteobacteria bacterium]